MMMDEHQTRHSLSEIKTSKQLFLMCTSHQEAQFILIYDLNKPNAN